MPLIKLLEDIVDLRAQVVSMRLALAHLPGILVGLYRADGYCALLEGVKLSEVKASEGHHFSEFLPAERRERFLWLFERALEGQESRTDYPIGADVMLEAIVKPVYDDDGAVGHVLFFCRDVTAERAARGARDSLTGLAKRSLLQAHLAILFRRSSPFVVLFIDLDGFKKVNDTLGHKTGDVVLEKVSRELQASVRAGDLAARIGGDEFAVALADAGDEPGKVARRILQRLVAVTEPFGASASMGLARYPAHGATIEAVIEAADAAMYRAKLAGGGELVVAE